MSLANQPLGFDTSFEKYVIKKDHSVWKEDPRTGKLEQIQDPQRPYENDFFKGSTAFWIKSHPASWDHWSVKIFMRFHIFFTRTLPNFFSKTLPSIFKSKKIENHTQKKKTPLDSNIGHSFIVIGNAKSQEALQESPHSLRLAHACDPGICVIEEDLLQQKDVDALVIYRPHDDLLREACRERAERTAYATKEILHREHSPQKKGEYKTNKECFKAFYKYTRHMVCDLLHIPERLKKRTASLIADALMGQQLLDEKEQPEAHICSSYAASVLQGGLFLRALQASVSNAEQAEFMKKAEGKSLSRTELIEKIKKILDGTVQTDDHVGQTIIDIYKKMKIVRLDSDYILPPYFLKKMDRLCLGSSDNPTP